MMNTRAKNFSRYGLAFLMVALLFLMMQLAVHATSEDEGGIGTFKVSSGNVNVRPDAGTSGDPTGQVHAGETYTVYEAKDGSDGHTWYKIKGTSNGTSIEGYVRDDLGEFTESAPAEEEPAETTEAPAEETPAETGTDATAVPENIGTILVMDPPAAEDGSESVPENLPAGFEETRIIVGEREVKAWVKNDTFYIFYATSPSGNVGWFLYDGAESRWIRYIDFLLEYGGGGEAAATGGGVSKGIVVALVILVVILAAGCGFMAFKLFSGKDYDDDDDDDDDDEDYRPAKRQPAKQVGAATSRPAGQRPAPQRPAPQRPAGAQGQRPAGAQGQRPAPQRPAGAQGQRPAPQRPAGAQGQRPAPQRPAGAQGQRPAGQGQPVRRQPQGSGAAVNRRSQDAPARRSQPVRQSRPMDEDDED